jgi:hypothetical protein
MNEQPLLNRKQAAAYVGASGESTIRAADTNGLPSRCDASGQRWYLPVVLDAWPWRSKPPSAAARARILREAAKGERPRHSLASAAGRELAVSLKDAIRGDKLHEKVARANEVARAAFLRDHMDERAACAQLFARDGRFEAKRKFRDLVRRRLLNEVPPPKEREVEGTWETAREVESFWPVVRGGPFFSNAEVLARYKESLQYASEERAPAGPLPTSPNASDDERVNEFLTRLLALAESADRRGPPAPPRP